MDPLSVTASILAVIGAAAKISLGLEQLWCLKDAPDVVYMIMNEVTDLCAITSVMENSIKSMEPATPELQQALNAIQPLADSAKETLNELDSLVHEKLLRNPDLAPQGRPKVMRLAWLRHSTQLQRLYKSLKITRQNLALSFSAVNTSHLSQIQPLLLQVREVVVTNKEHLARVENAAPYTAESHMSIHSKLDQVIHRLDDLNMASNSASNASQSLTKFQGDHPPLSNTTPRDDIVAINTSVSLMRCSNFCRCSCHVHVTEQTPRSIKAVFGHLFFDYAGKISLDRRVCDYPMCERRARTSMRLCYMFPRWAISRAICITGVWQDLSGVGASWTIRMPRLVPWGPIWSSIEHGDEMKVLEMFKDGMSSPFDIHGTDGRSLLHHAIWYRRFDICHKIAIQGADWGHRDIDGSSVADVIWPLLITGVGHRDYSLSEIRLLLERNHDFDNLQFNSLHMIAAGLSKLPISEQLFLDGAQVNARDAHGRTPLMWAAMRNDVESATVLLQWKADVSVKDREGLTALHYSARHDSFECAEILLLAGCETNLPDYAGRTPIIDFCYYSRAQKTQMPMFKLLVKWGADVHYKSSRRWWTCLHMAASSGNSEILAALLDMGVDIDSRNKDGNTPLMMAISENSLATASVLLNLGARVDFYNNFGRGTLMLAARYAGVPLLEVLTNAKLCGLGKDATDHEGFTARDHFEKVHDRETDEESPGFPEDSKAFECLLRSARAEVIIEDLEATEKNTSLQEMTESEWIDNNSDTASNNSMPDAMFHSCCTELESGVNIEV